MSRTKEKKLKYLLTDEDTAMIHLYQQLTIEQCIELFKQNLDNYSPALKNRLYVIIGAKTVWGEDYKPNKNYKDGKKVE